MLSKRQNAVYRPLVKAAWIAFCQATGRDTLSKAAYNDWYRKELVDSAHVYTSKQVSDPDTFDALCLHFARLSNNTAEIEYWSTAKERRALWRLGQTMKKAGVGWAYVQAISEHQGNGDKRVDELPADRILKINSALDMHVQRQARSCVTA